MSQKTEPSEPTSQPSLDHRTSRKDFADRFRATRRRLGTKQCWVASAVGCTSSCVSQWESGRRVPDPLNLHRLLAALEQAGASPHELDELRKCWWTARHQTDELLHDGATT